MDALPVTTVRDAASVLVMRDANEGPHVFMVRRHRASAWLADHYVFPGGALEAGDHDDVLAAAVDQAAGPLAPAFVVAAARETFEECGLLFVRETLDPRAVSSTRRALLRAQTTFGAALAALGATLDASQMRYFSRWITPEGEARRFDARFFVARTPPGQIAEADALEVLDGRWVRPADALAAYARGEFAMIFPTLKHLERIAQFASVDDVMAFARRKAIATVRPHFDEAGALAIAPELADAW